jgi:phosphopantetheinyl transferase
MDREFETQDGIIYTWFDKGYHGKRIEGYAKKEIDRLEVKHKLKQIFPNAELIHDENGAPIIKNADYPFISVSHYQGWFTFYLSYKKNGVDIQSFKKSLSKGRSYFINSNENYLELSQLNLHLIWCAKEAFYKKYNGDIEDLKNDVSVTKIDLNVNQLSLEYKDCKEDLSFLVNKEYVIVWT